MRISLLFALILAVTALISSPTVLATDVTHRSPIVIAVQTDGMTSVEREFIRQNEDYLTYVLLEPSIVFQHSHSTPD